MEGDAKDAERDCPSPTRVMSSIRSRGLTLIALALGAAPGFLLPVVVTWRLSLVPAAALLLAITLTQIAYAALGGAYETTMLVRLGTLYGANDASPRLPIRGLAVNAVVRVGPILLLGAAALVVGTGLLSPDIDFAELVLLTIPVGAGLLIQVSSTPLSAHLYATRRLPSAYFSTFFLGGPSLFVALVWPEALAISVTYFVGQLLRWVYLEWRVSVSQRNVAHGEVAVVLPPTWRELSPQVLSSVAGQLMPILVQGLLAASGAAAVATGAIAFRVWGAAWQAGTSTLAMPEVVTLTREVLRIAPEDRVRWIDRRGLRLILASTVLGAIGAAAIIVVARLPAGLLPPVVSVGLWWSLIALIAFPFGMLNFWAVRGLVTIGAGWWLPILILIAFVIGGAASGVAVPFLGGIGAMIGFASGIVAQGIATFIVFRRLAPRSYRLGDAGGSPVPGVDP